MAVNPRLQIYQGIIVYLLESTNYTLKNIAEFTDSSIKHLQSIYQGEYLPIQLSSEHQLIKLYQIILKIQMNNNPSHLIMNRGCLYENTGY